MILALFNPRHLGASFDSFLFHFIVADCAVFRLAGVIYQDNTALFSGVASFMDGIDRR
jgi:hypothetical protein